MITRKRILALVLTLVLTLSCIPMGAFRAQAAELETDIAEVTETVPEDTTEEINEDAVTAHTEDLPEEVPEEVPEETVEETAEDTTIAHTENIPEEVTEEATEAPDEATDAPDLEFEEAYANEAATYATAHTQAEAIAWLKSMVGSYLDVDGAYGAQCVDLILAYYDYLGVPRSSGNAVDYTANALPSGWQRIQGATPQAGDILVYGANSANPAGHVAIYESERSTFHQNFSGHSYVENITYIRYDGFTNPYWGVIRPDFTSTPIATTISWGSDDCQPDSTNAFIYTKATSNISGTFTQAGITIWQNGSRIGGKDEYINTPSSYLEVWYNLTNELGLVLSPGTFYTYQFYVVFNGTRYTGEVKSFKTAGPDIATPAKPSKIANVATGVQLQWSAVNGISKYGVWRSEVEGGPYTLVGTATSTLYTDTKVTAGKTYYYRITAMDASGANSNMSDIVSITFVTAPKVVAATSGAYVYWDAIAGASKYGVWCSKNGINGTYTLLTTTTATNYTNRNVPSGSTYYYAISIVGANGNHSARSKAVNHTFLSTPTSSVSNVAAGVKVSWNRITGALGYAVYRKTYTSSVWTRVHTIKDGDTLSWTDESVRAKNGQGYHYTVRALAGSKLTIQSAQRINGTPIVRLTSQTLKSAVKVSATAIKCTWSTSTVVAGYEVRLMTGGSVYKTYKVPGKTTASKALTGLPRGKTYTVQIRTYATLGTGTYYSAWSNAKSVTLP